MRQSLFGLVFSVILLYPSCSRRDLALFFPSTYFPEESGGEVVSWLPNTLPENVLENLKTCYNHRNVTHYDSLLAAGYRFYMSETYLGSFNTVNAQPPDPAYWI